MRGLFPQALVGQLVLLLVRLFGDLAVVEGEIDGVHFGVEGDVVEVPYDYRERREHGLIEVYRDGDVNPPARQEAERANLEPDEQARQPHDQSAPHDGPIFGLLRVAEASYLRLTLPYTSVVEKVLPQVSRVLPLRQHVANP